MNIVQLQDRLKDLSDQQLQSEMQNPSGSAPQYLVLSELKRRKDMRDRYQATQGGGGKDLPPMSEMYARGQQMPSPAQPQGPQPQMQQPLQPPRPMPQQGIAQGMPMQKFQSGGAVSRRYTPSNPYANLPRYLWPGAQSADLRLNAGNYGTMATESYVDPRIELQQGLSQGMIPARNVPVQGPTPYEAVNSGPGFMENVGSMFSGAKDAMTWPGLLRDGTSFSDLLRFRGVGREALPEQSVAQGSAAPTPYEDEFSGTPTVTKDVPVMLDTPGVVGISDQVGPPMREVPASAGLGSPAARSAASSVTPVSSATPIIDTSIDTSESTSALPATAQADGTMSEADKMLKEYYEGLSGRQSKVAGMRDRIAALAEDAEAQESRDMGMALARAGFAMASGDSPYFAQNVGAAGMAGLDAAEAARSRRDAMEMKQLGLEMEVAGAEDRFGLAQGEQQAKYAQMLMSGEQFDKEYAMNMIKAERSFKQGDIELGMKQRQLALEAEKLALTERKYMDDLPESQAARFQTVKEQNPEGWKAFLEVKAASSVAGRVYDERDAKAQIASKYIEKLRESPAGIQMSEKELQDEGLRWAERVYALDKEAAGSRGSIQDVNGRPTYVPAQ